MDAESLTQLEQIITRAATTLKAELRQDIESSAADVKRHTGVLVEELRHELQLVAEGLQAHIDQRHTEDREYLDHQLRETRALMRLSYDQLHQRVERLEQRVQAIE